MDSSPEFTICTQGSYIRVHWPERQINAFLLKDFIEGETPSFPHILLKPLLDSCKDSSKGKGPHVYKNQPH